MSSQGPSSGPTAAAPPFCTGPTGGSPSVEKGYAFTTASIRDGSDWTAYKKQLLIRNENKSKITSDPFFAHGNDYRLQYLLGVYKGGVTGCTGCKGDAFGSTGPY